MMVALRKESVDRNNGRLRAVQNAQMSLSARRAWIEMTQGVFNLFANPSLSARRAWIEIRFPGCAGRAYNGSLSARRAWIEIVYLYNFKMFACMSLSARRAWIEILNGETLSALACSSLSARRAWIEILYQLYDTYAKVVALRKESVDRNGLGFCHHCDDFASLSARRAWIEINCNGR